MFGLRKIATALALGTGLLVAGCGGDQVKVDGGPNGPAWINKGANAFDDGKFYGVGVDTGTSNVSLRRSAADAKARAELAKQFSTKIKALIKTYDASTQDSDAEAAESHRQEAIKAFTQMDISGAQICDRFYSKDDRTQFSLACLDPDQFGAQLDQMKQLSGRAKQIIRANADKAFRELDAEAEKGNQ
jgi:hypothetical protein